MGVEPTCPGPQPGALPLSYIHILRPNNAAFFGRLKLAGEGGFEPPKAGLEAAGLAAEPTLLLGGRHWLKIFGGLEPQEGRP